MNINLEKLYAEMKGRPWNGGIQSILANLRCKKLTGNFPIPFVKVKGDKTCGFAQLPREDFPIFGIDPKNDSFDLVQCSKCNVSYRLQNVEQHLESHNKVQRGSTVTDSPESFSSISLPSTPPKAAKKEMPKVTKKYVLSSPPSADTIPSTDISSDPDVSSSGDFSYPSDGSNLSNNGAIKTDLDYGGVPNNSHQTPVNFSSSIKAKHILLDKVKKANNKDSIIPSRRPQAASKAKEYDPNRHCGVCTEESGWNPCLHSLTCKSHVISLRRAVPGRCKTFDELLLEHRVAKGSKALVSKSKKKATPPTRELLVTVTPVQVSLTRHPTPAPTPPAPPLEVKVEPMQVEDAPPALPAYREELKPKPQTTTAQPPVIEVTTRVRRSALPPQPMSLPRARGMCLVAGRVYPNPAEAYWMKLLSANVIQSSAMKSTININALKKTLYPAQFFNIMGNGETAGTISGGNFVPMSNGRYTFSQRDNSMVKNMSLLGNFS